jgi:lysophospholipid acyltransferase (LPLAT)-like uncharacterized protein
MATPRVFRHLLQSSAVQWLLAAAAAVTMVGVGYTARIGRPDPPPGGPFILAMWHSRLVMLDWLRPNGRALIILISEHRDGMLIGRIAWLGSFGQIRAVTGSTSKGAARAIRKLMRHARAGNTLFITPDGPRGPNMRAQRGVIEIARLTGLPILPASVSARWHFRLRSWDRFMVPLPFTRAEVRWGEPIYVDQEADGNAMLARIEAALTACQALADEACGIGGNPERITSPVHSTS